MQCCSESRKKPQVLILRKIWPNDLCCASTCIPALALPSQVSSHLSLGRLPCPLTSLCPTKALLWPFKKWLYLAKICRAVRLYVPCSAQPTPGDNPSPVFLQKRLLSMASHPAGSCLLWMQTTAKHLQMFPSQWEPKVSANSCNTSPSLET